VARANEPALFLVPVALAHQLLGGASVSRSASD